MHLADLLHQLGATLLSPALGTIPPGVVPAARDLQNFAQELHRELPSSLVDEGEPFRFWLAK
jgi:hypothetical protein